ncbi:uncharacterized protein PFL1_02301 [Pseudozyma flocculosa PF-1]|uniref:Uncharacterized protein n=1 Tax=Pseudozyma flocculosa TaxID=84751 RepID=A0A5C3F944_9BASI|nr:uncharacterized protein PFL1_02301 [Pseudozyma flocculosa PF-1]EPQ30185.1 hypothetical protein PFL1_02301 [Pseudozyma flocculosa PF-1]SPO39889.1 uncharacterized protein PSFLO_05370 [Pseudozyma flocculosa]
MLSLSSALGQMKANTMQFLSPASSPERASAAPPNSGVRSTTTDVDPLISSIQDDAAALTPLPRSQSASSISTSTPAQTDVCRPSTTTPRRATAQLTKLQQRLLYDSDSDSSLDISFDSPGSSDSHSSCRSSGSDYSDPPSSATSSSGRESCLSKGRTDTGSASGDAKTGSTSRRPHLRSSIAVQRVLLGGRHGTDSSHSGPSSSSSSSASSSARSSYRKSRSSQGSSAAKKHGGTFLADPIDFPLPPSSLTAQTSSRDSLQGGRRDSKPRTSRLYLSSFDEDEEDDTRSDPDAASDGEDEPAQDMKAFLRGLGKKRSPTTLGGEGRGRGQVGPPERSRTALPSLPAPVESPTSYKFLDRDADSGRPLASREGGRGTATMPAAAATTTIRTTSPSPALSSSATISSATASVSTAPTSQPPSPTYRKDLPASPSGSTLHASPSSSSLSSSLSSSSLSASSPSSPRGNKIRPLQTLRQRTQTGTSMRYLHSQQPAAAREGHGACEGDDGAASFLDLSTSATASLRGSATTQAAPPPTPPPRQPLLLPPDLERDVEQLKKDARSLIADIQALSFGIETRDNEWENTEVTYRGTWSALDAFFWRSLEYDAT